MRIVVLSAVCSFLALGCHAPREDSGAATEHVGRATNPIFYGQPDTAHSAVVYVDLGGGSCSGTIIAVCNGTGYVLTAAHCCSSPVQQIIIGDDANDPNAATFPASQTLPDPAYNGASDDDFCVVQFTGATANLSVIPAMTSADDALQAGDMVDFVGYGITETNSNNTQRRHVIAPLTNVTVGTVRYSQQPGGPCDGDSGGPALLTVGGKELVAAVTSQGDQGCVQFGESGRVSRVYESFIVPNLGACVPGSSSSTSSSVAVATANSATSSTSVASSSGAGVGSTGSGGAGGGTNKGGSTKVVSCACEAGSGGTSGLGFAMAIALTAASVSRRRRKH